MGCNLNIIGENLNVDAFVSETKMSGFRKSYKGEPLAGSKRRISKFSAASITTSAAEFDDIKSQVKDTIHFLTAHKDNLKVIASTPGIEYAVIDFGVNSKINDDCLTQTFNFPKTLIKICAELDIGIELSLYKEDIQVILERRRTENNLRKSE